MMRMRKEDRVTKMRGLLSWLLRLMLSIEITRGSLRNLGNWGRLIWRCLIILILRRWGRELRLRKRLRRRSSRSSIPIWLVHHFPSRLLNTISKTNRFRISRTPHLINSSRYYLISHRSSRRKWYFLSFWQASQNFHRKRPTRNCSEMRCESRWWRGWQAAAPKSCSSWAYSRTQWVCRLIRCWPARPLPKWAATTTNQTNNSNSVQLP